ncbi:MAG: glycosyltransferase [Bacteroidales bacterium]|nr:glycosyltransferase [Bacteroidales bacterium]
MELTVIIPTFNRSKIVNKTLQKAIEILQQVNIVFEIIVVNDGSEEVDFHHNQLILVKNKKKGVASARNFGASISKYPNLLFLDDDILITYESTEKIIHFFCSSLAETHCLNVAWIYPPELIVKCEKTNFGRYLKSIDYISMKGWMNPQTWKEQSFYEIDTLASYCLAITKKNFNRIGGYNEHFPYSGFEDYEFAQRALIAKIKTLLDTSIFVFHNEEDRLDVEDWMNRRYREGVTRACYIKLTNDIKYEINPNYIKKTLYHIIYVFKRMIIWKVRLFDFKVFDFITFPIIKILTGSFIWKGYINEYYKKD